MKLLFDFLPIVLFFGMFKYAEGHLEWAAATATQWLGFMVQGGQVGAKEAPVLLATVVVIVATLAQVAWLLVRGKKIDTMLWVSLALVVVMGGATIYFHDENFIKWKPTLLYWAMGGALAVGQLMGRNFIRSLMGHSMAKSGSQEASVPDAVWHRLAWAWATFFLFMGALNLYVAMNFATETWVNFKLFGSLGFTIGFAILSTMLLLGPHMKDNAKKDAP